MTNYVDLVLSHNPDFYVTLGSKVSAPNTNANVLAAATDLVTGNVANIAHQEHILKYQQLTPFGYPSMDGTSAVNENGVGFVLDMSGPDTVTSTSYALECWVLYLGSGASEPPRRQCPFAVGNGAYNFWRYDTVDNRFEFYYHNGNNPPDYTIDGTLTMFDIFTPYKWHYVVYKWADGNLTLYVDLEAKVQYTGVTATSFAFPREYSIMGWDLHAGEITGNRSCWYGRVMHCAAYLNDATLTEAQMEEHYNAMTNPAAKEYYSISLGYGDGVVNDSATKPSGWGQDESVVIGDAYILSDAALYDGEIVFDISADTLLGESTFVLGFRTDGTFTNSSLSDAYAIPNSGYAIVKQNNDIDIATPATQTTRWSIYKVVGGIDENFYNDYTHDADILTETRVRVRWADDEIRVRFWDPEAVEPDTWDWITKDFDPIKENGTLSIAFTEDSLATPVDWNVDIVEINVLDGPTQRRGISY